VPASAVAAIVLRRNALAMPRAFLASATELTADLGGYLARELGVDLTRVEGLAAYSTSTGARSGVVVLRLRESGALRGRATGSYRGVELVEVGPGLVAASVPGGVAIGTPTEVATAIDLGQRRVAAVASDSAIGAALARAPGETDLVAAVAVAGLGAPPFGAIVQQFGVTGAHLAFRADGLLTLRVEGDPSRLAAVGEIFRAGGGMFIEQLRRQKLAAERRHDVGAAVSAILGYHLAQRAFQEITPRVDGAALVSQYRLPKLDVATTYAVWGGMAAALAIPAFIKYTRRAKAAEARMNLGLLRSGVRGWYAAHRTDGRKLAFPASTPWSPALECCKTKTAPKCAPGLGAFAHPTWKALRFDLVEPHYFQYRVTSEGKGKAARVVLEARGDLGCDGTVTAYRIAAHVDAKGELEVGDLEPRE
jgi:hypothetical protein